MLLFRSEEHVRRWYDRWKTPLGATLTLQQQWDLARAWYEDRASPTWRRRSAVEVETVFAGIGLTSPFWRLTPPT